MEIPYRREQMETDDGTICVGRWGVGERVVVASHGITANHLSWQRVAEYVVERSDGAVNIVALDHRGRAGSADAPGPYGLHVHADDVARAVDHYAGTGLVVGHSMGAFVATLAAERHPGSVRRLVLVDGGLPIPMDLPADADAEQVVQAVIGPALDRLDQRWDDEEAYVDFFRSHPAFAPPNEWPATAEAYVRYDACVTPEGQVASSVRKDAVLVDGGAAIVDPDSSRALERISVPTSLLWAPRGILDQMPGLYSQPQIDEAATLGHVSVELVDDTNHYTIAVGEVGAARAADAILEVS